VSRADVTARSYTAEQKAEAVGLAYSVGPKKAGEQLGIPPRTVAYWKSHGTGSAVVEAAISVVAVDIASRLRAAHELALERVIDGLQDPRSRLGDRATALRTLGEQLALAENRATANIDIHAEQRQSLLQGFDEEARDAIRDWLATRTHGEQWLANEMAALEEGRLGPEASMELRNDLAEAEDLAALQQALIDPTNMPRDQILAAVRAIEAKIGGDSGGN
jgi:hypothetical protein